MEWFLEFPIAKSKSECICFIDVTPGDEDWYYVQVHGKTLADKSLLDQIISYLQGSSVTLAPPEAVMDPAIYKLAKKLMTVAPKAFPKQFPFKYPYVHNDSCGKQAP